MLTLHGFGPKLGLADASPYVLRLDAYLRLCGVPFERHDDVSFISKTPHGRLPCLSDDGTLVADSFRAIDHLRSVHQIDPDRHLHPAQLATTQLVTRLFTGHVYWLMLRARWVDDAGFAHIDRTFFADLPQPLRFIIPKVARRNIIRDCRGMGVLDYSKDEWFAEMHTAMRTLDTLLGEQDFFLGDQAQSVDATAYAFLSQVFLASMPLELTEAMQGHTALKAFCLRFHEQFYPDLKHRNNH